VKKKNKMTDEKMTKRGGKHKESLKKRKLESLRGIFQNHTFRRKNLGKSVKEQLTEKGTQVSNHDHQLGRLDRVMTTPH
jgi:hypothetical protein